MPEIVIRTGTAGLVLACSLGLKDSIRSMGDWTTPGEIVFEDAVDAEVFQDLLDERHRELGFKK